VSETRHKKIAATDLSIGMFVAELDRPWLGTPFLLEGVLIEEQKQINLMIELCKFVYIDFALSVGDFRTLENNTNPSKLHHSIQQKSSSSHTSTPTMTITKPQQINEQQFSFFDVLKEIKNSQKNKQAPSLDRIAPINAAFIQKQHLTSGIKPSYETTFDDVSLSEQIKQDIAGIVAGITKRSNRSASDKKAGILADHLARKQIKNDKIANPVEKEIVKVYPTFEKTHIATRQIFEAIAQDHQINLENVNEALDGMVESIERNPDALMWLAKLKQNDNDAYNHAMNVSITMMAIANFMSLPKKQVKDLGLVGLLQDIGKAQIDEKLLHKVEKITTEDYEVFKKHVQYSIKLLNSTENIPSNVVQIVAQHHERIDGSGYPNKLIGKQINLMGQLAGLIDSYCAITTDRAYAKGVYNQQALEEIHQLRGTKFSGVLIDQLVQFLGMYPVTTLVELNTGEVGVVIEQNSVRRLLPRVLVLLNPDKSKNPSPITINLLNQPLTPNGDPYTIVRSLPPNSYGLNPSNYYAE
jgi:HD-GYP domain-containing protein (c-di-GMP phosphodiesterase class II)